MPMLCAGATANPKITSKTINRSLHNPNSAEKIIALPLLELRPSRLKQRTNREKMHFSAVRSLRAWNSRILPK
jgi:hypothetical protein